MSDGKMTLDQVKSSFPKHMRKYVSDETLRKVNDIIGSSEEMLETYRENLISYSSVLMDGRYKVDSYLNAIKYVSYKLLGDSNEKAYAKTFPIRYKKYVDAGLGSRELGAYSSGYNSSKLVSGILTQSMVPFYVVNAPMYQAALNCQVQLMNSAKSEKVRCDAANSVLVQLKPPETSKIQLDIGIKEDKTIDELRQTTLQLVAQQRQMLLDGSSKVKEIAHSKLAIARDEDIIEGEIIER